MKTCICLLVCLSTLISVTAREKKSISWFEPGSGKAGTEVIIGVKGFDIEDKSIGVFFGNKQAHILKKTSDHFVVSVPEGSSDGPIVIKDASGQITSETVFLTGIKANLTTQAQILPLANKAKPALMPAETPSIPIETPSIPIETPRIPIETPKVPVEKKETTKQQNSLNDSNVLSPSTGPRKVMHLVKNKKAIIPNTTLKTTTAAGTISQAAAGTSPALTDKETILKPEHIVDNGKLPVSNTLDRPLILGFEPKNGPVGTVIRISGLNFGFDKNNVVVNLKNGQSLMVNSVYDQIIEVTIPAGTHQSGSLVVIVNGKKSVSHDSFKTL